MKYSDNQISSGRISLTLDCQRECTLSSCVRDDLYMTKLDPPTLQLLNDRIKVNRLTDDTSRHTQRGAQLRIT